VPKAKDITRIPIFLGLIRHFVGIFKYLGSTVRNRISRLFIIVSNFLR